ncbi:MAG: hypothetical protein RI897_1498 [Verrucomicrobiota bacterium]
MEVEPDSVRAIIAECDLECDCGGSGGWVGFGPGVAGAGEGIGVGGGLADQEREQQGYESVSVHGGRLEFEVQDEAGVGRGWDVDCVVSDGEVHGVVGWRVKICATDQDAVIEAEAGDNRGWRVGDRVGDGVAGVEEFFVLEGVGPDLVDELDFCWALFRGAPEEEGVCAAEEEVPEEFSIGVPGHLGGVGVWGQGVEDCVVMDEGDEGG